MKFGNPVKLNIPYEEARAAALEEFDKEGFGAITEIDVKATLKRKLDEDFRNYTILGMCNPPFAQKALQRNLEVGLLMPCNVVVYDNDDGTTTISPLNIQQIMSNFVPEMKDLAEDVGNRIDNAIGRMKEKYGV